MGCLCPPHFMRLCTCCFDPCVFPEHSIGSIVGGGSCILIEEELPTFIGDPDWCGQETLRVHHAHLERRGYRYLPKKGRMLEPVWHDPSGKRIVGMFDDTDFRLLLELIGATAKLAQKRRA